MLSPIFTSFLQDRSRSGTTDICLNLYPEHTDGPQGPEIGVLLSAPGARPLFSVGAGPIREVYAARDGNLYVVSGPQFVRVDAGTLNQTPLGNLTTGTGPVKIVDSPTQLLIVDGSAGWCWDTLSSTFTQVIPNSGTDDVGPNSIAYQDGFAIVTSRGSNQVYQSNYNDLATFASLVGGGLGTTANNAFVQGNPKDVVALFDLKREVWIFKTDAAEVWINQGNPGFAFVPLQGVYLSVGCNAPASVARLGESVVWLGGSSQGNAVVYMTEGYGAKPISTHALSNQIQSFPIVSDAIAYCYQAAQHYFYVLTFPSQNVTFVYDLATGKWCQRGYFSNGEVGRELANCHAFFNGWHVVGDYRSGQLYDLDDQTYTDNGQPRKWARSWRALPPTMPASEPLSFDSLQVLMETGITVPSGTNPQIDLEWSDDGGYTWNGPFQVAAGKIGETAWRVFQPRLGSTTERRGLDRVFRISGNDPIAIKITGADVDVSPS